MNSMRKGRPEHGESVRGEESKDQDREERECEEEEETEEGSDKKTTQTGATSLANIDVSICDCTCTSETVLHSQLRFAKCLCPHYRCQPDCLTLPRGGHSQAARSRRHRIRLGYRTGPLVEACSKWQVE